MISKFKNFWQILKGNLWFVPAIFCVLSFAFIFSFYTFEVHYLKDLQLPEYVFQGSSDDAKSVITALLSAMITMATLAISITIVVLSLAASQMGPRLIKSFMADRRTKDFIGLFFTAVIACFVLTIILHSRTGEVVTPQITISLVFVICFINLFVLLGFVHHVAQSSNADHVILQVSANLNNAVNRLTKDHADQTEPENNKADWPKDFDAISRSLYFDRSGYVQNIDYDEIVAIAAKNNLRMDIAFKAGHFLLHGESGIRLYTKSKTPDDIDKQIKNCIIIGDSRTATQDIEYSVRHLVEIAIRALSPGINDSFTAMSVLDHLSDGIAILLTKEVPSTCFYDDEGVKRINAKQSTEADIIFTAFDQIRCNASHLPSIMRHLLDRFFVLSQLIDSHSAKQALLEQVKGLNHDLEHNNQYVPDREYIQTKAQALMKALN